MTPHDISTLPPPPPVPDLSELEVDLSTVQWGMYRHPYTDHIETVRPARQKKERS